MFKIIKLSYSDWKANSWVDLAVNTVNLEAMNSNNPAAELEAVPMLKNRICSESANGPLSLPGIVVAVTLV